MSGALASDASLRAATGLLSDAERVDVRRYLGYPLYGIGNTGAGFSGYRFFVSYGQLEYHMNNLGAAELAVLRAKLAEIAALDLAIAASAARLSTDQAAVWRRNRDEVRDRRDLFKDRCRELAAFLGVPAGPANSRGGSIAMVV